MDLINKKISFVIKSKQLKKSLSSINCHSIQEFFIYVNLISLSENSKSILKFCEKYKEDNKLFIYFQYLFNIFDVDDIDLD